MDIQNAFAELGLTPQASPAEAKAAYRTLAMRWHPDLNTGLQTDAHMQRINVAYALVSQHLDARAAAAQATSRAAKTPSGFTEFDWKAGFKPAAHSSPTPRAACVERTLRVSLFEAAFGCVKRVSGMESVPCVRCAGSGTHAGSWTVGAKCLRCFGHGMVNACAGGTVKTVCETCRGSGVFKPAPPHCPGCMGSGKTTRQTWTVDVAIHAGTLDGALVEGSDIRMRTGAQALPHSFKLTVQIEKHPLFKLHQNRLSVTVPISVWRWALGGEITVPTLDGSARVSLPTTPSALLVKNQGWPEYQAPERRKPLFVLPKVIYPEQLRIEERRMLELLDVRSRMPELQSWSRHMQAWTESSTDPG
jgi:molecular chaperone DnaJ